MGYDLLHEADLSSKVKMKDYPTPAYAWYVVVLLTLAYVVSFIDRQVMNLLVEPIKADLALSDTQMSLLLGFAFAIFYSVMGIPMGRIADRYNRCRLIIIGITLWCTMTACCGLARNYLQLFLARVGVGVGEAALSPAALSIISDSFPKEKRILPIGFYNIGIYVGAGLAMILGGLVIDYIQNAPPLVLPGLGELRPWQTTFVLIGIPGLLLAALMGTVKEPARKELLTAGTNAEALSFRFFLEYLRRRWRSYGAVFAGMAFLTVITYSNFAWVPTMFIRTHNWEIKEIGLIYGAIVLSAGPLGIYLGGLLGNALYNAGRKNGLMLGALVGTLFLTPSTLLAPLMPTPELAMVLLFLASLGLAFVTANMVPALLLITPNQLRGQTYALFLLTLNLVGPALGPTAVALVTDFVFFNEAMLRYSLSIITGLAGLCCIVFFYLGLSPYRASVLEAEQGASQ